MNDFIVGPGSPCSECNGVYGQHAFTCTVLRNRPPDLSARLDDLAKSSLPDDQRLQALIHLTRELAKEVECL